MIQLLTGDVIEQLKKLPDEHVQLCVTSPPYFSQRSYGVDGQIGLEESLDKYVEKMVEVFREVRRVLRKDGIIYINIGDSYATSVGKFGRHDTTWDCSPQHKPGSFKAKAGVPAKNLLGVPWRVALAMQQDRWILRTDIIWDRPSRIPEGDIKDRPLRNHEYIFLMAKSTNYYYDRDAKTTLERFPSLLELDARYHWSVWKIVQNSGSDKCCGKCLNIFSLQEYGRMAKDPKTQERICRTCGSVVWDAHAAPYPENLVAPCILAGTSDKGACKNCGTCWIRDGKNWKKNCKCSTEETKACIVLDPFSGSGTTGVVSIKLGRDYIGVDLNKDYVRLSKERMKKVMMVSGSDVDA